MTEIIEENNNESFFSNIGFGDGYQQHMKLNSRTTKENKNKWILVRWIYQNTLTIKWKEWYRTGNTCKSLIDKHIVLTA